MGTSHESNHRTDRKEQSSIDAAPIPVTVNSLAVGRTVAANHSIRDLSPLAGMPLEAFIGSSGDSAGGRGIDGDSERRRVELNREPGE